MNDFELRQSESFVKGLSSIYPIPIPYRHWQLRDMIKSDGEKIVYNEIDKMMAFDIQSNNVQILAENLTYYPTTFDVNEKFLAYGSFKGEISIYNRCTKVRSDLEVGYTIVNSVKIKDKFLYVCSNEKTISVIDLNKCEVTNIYKHSSQINNCAISQNGDYLVACGDTKETLLFRRSNDFLELVNKLECVNDGGFGVSWNNDGSLFGVGTQDGYACVWDIRYDEKLSAIKSHQHPYASGAIRNLQFTKKNLVDMLVFTEHYSYFTIVDTRSFKKKQLVSVNEATCEKSITGLVVNEKNDKIYISTSENILEYPINTKIRRMTCYGEIF